MVAKCRKRLHHIQITLSRIAGILLLTFPLVCKSYGQTSTDTIPPNPIYYYANLEKHISILAGYNFWRNHFAELGLAVNQYGRVGHHPSAWAYFISSELKFDDKVLIGPKIGTWIGGGAGGMAMGLNLIYYTDFEQSSLRIRPEIGIGFERFKMVYGYNIPLYNKAFQGINKSNFGVALLFSIKHLKTQTFH